MNRHAVILIAYVPSGFFLLAVLFQLVDIAAQEQTGVVRLFLLVSQFFFLPAAYLLGVALFGDGVLQGMKKRAREQMTLASARERELSTELRVPRYILYSCKNAPCEGQERLFLHVARLAGGGNLYACSVCAEKPSYADPAHPRGPFRYGQHGEVTEQPYDPGYILVPEVAPSPQ